MRLFRHFRSFLVLLSCCQLDAASAGTATISGTVTAEVGGAGLQMVGVSVYRFANGIWQPLAGAFATTDPFGNYTVGGLPAGSYRLEFKDLTGSYAAEFYNNASTVKSATTVSVPDGSRVSGINVALVKAATMSGSVTAEGGGGLQGISVIPRRWEQSGEVWEELTPTLTEASGSFKLEGLAPGTYTFEFVDQSDAYLREFFNNAPNLTAATRVELQSEQNFQDAKVALALAGYDAWKSSYGVTGLQTSDDDQDGLSNGAEYALGTNPRQFDADKALIFRTSGSDFILEFLRRNHGANSFLQETDDLGHGSWSTSLATVSESPNQAGVAVSYTRMRCVVPAIGLKFFRVVATY